MQNKTNTILLVLIVILLAVGVWFLANGNTVTTDTDKKPVVEEKLPVVKKEPVVEQKKQVPATKTIILGQEFTAHIGEVFTVKDSGGNTFEVTGFYFAPCPPGGACIWSGLDVFYTIKTTIANGQQGKVYIKDQPAQHLANSPYTIFIKDSDYKTYAKIILETQGTNL